MEAKDIVAEEVKGEEDNVKLVTLHNLILKICQDKYAVPEMMAERITKEVNDYIKGQINRM